ncbi:MAG: 6-phosphofructokinase [Anaerolineae bacterium]|nr:6-phosphofructokinase [Anaerolineae bacterium]NUQ02653.1 6-phosphofructokinase [Anaerolineae bacterium]
MTQYIGILTAGGDSPGLNAAIRGVGKAGLNAYGMQIIGFRDGFRGLMENRTVTLNSAALSGILTIGGTILGTSRDKPQKMPIGSKTMDMTDVMVETYHNHHLDVLVCLGGGGTVKNAFHLMKQGLNIITLPKTIDNDVAMTDITFGYDTALTIATEAIDRLHSTAHSHHRIIVVEVMGHNAGWLALGAGIAGGADVILIPEIPYSAEKVATSIRQRVRDGKGFSIVAVSEGAVPQELHERILEASKNGKGKDAKAELAALEAERLNSTQKLTQQLEGLTGLESRVTILGHVQRGGIPSPADRLLATRLGSACARYIHEGVFGVMVAARGDSTEPVPLEEVVGKRKTVPLDHPWIETARNLGINLGD